MKCYDCHYKGLVRHHLGGNGSSGHGLILAKWKGGLMLRCAISNCDYNHGPGKCVP